MATMRLSEKPALGNENWVGTGSIRGLVRVPSSLRPQITRVTIAVEEAINSGKLPVEPSAPIRRKLQTVLFPEGKNEAYFEVVDLPFSKYGWRVSPRVPQLNGSEAYVVLRPEEPNANVQLSVSPGIPVSLTVRDQHRHPLESIPIELRPKGRPLGRPVKKGKTDAYGLIVLNRVLAGPYELHVGTALEPLAAPRRIEIAREGHQYEQVELPRGGRFEAQIIDEISLGIDAVQVEMIAVDSKIYRKYTGRSDKNGKVALPHIPPGRYYVHFTKKGFERLFRQVTVRPNGNTPLHCLLKRER